MFSLAFGVGFLLAGALSAVTDAASGFPSKPITVLNSSTAGSPTDVLARQVAQYARKSLGQPMVVVNKPGGGGGVMFAGLFAEPADGYTIASLTASQVAALHAELKKDFSFENFDFIANVQREPNCLAAKWDGVLHVRTAPLVAINALDPLEVFTLFHAQCVTSGEVVASVKVAPHLVPGLSSGGMRSKSTAAESQR